MTDRSKETGIAAVQDEPGGADALTKHVQGVLEGLRPYLGTGLLYRRGQLQRLVFPFQDTAGCPRSDYLAFKGTQRNPCARILIGESWAEQILQHYRQEGYVLEGSLTLGEAMDQRLIQAEDLYSMDRDRLRELCLGLQFSRVCGLRFRNRERVDPKPIRSPYTG
jgi:hypothetical protein